MTVSGEFGQGEKVLSRAAGMVADAKSDFDVISSTLMNNVDGLKSSWAGQGAKAFQDLALAWHEKQTKIVNALNEFEQNLIATERDNVSTDDNQLDSMMTLQNSLGALPGA